LASLIVRRILFFTLSVLLQAAFNAVSDSMVTPVSVFGMFLAAFWLATYTQRELF